MSFCIKKPASLLIAILRDTNNFIHRTLGAASQSITDVAATAVNNIHHVSENEMKKIARRRRTLRAGCSKAEPKIFARRRPLPGGAGRPKFNQLEMVTTFT